jgi:hypothetical protein
MDMDVIALSSLPMQATNMFIAAFELSKDKKKKKSKKKKKIHERNAVRHLYTIYAVVWETLTSMRRTRNKGRGRETNEDSPLTTAAYQQ